MAERKDKFLSVKHRRVCEEYLVDCNKIAALVRAGYSPATARTMSGEFFKDPEIQSYIKYLQAAVRDRCRITQERVIKDIVEVKERCMQAKQIYKYDKDTKDYEPVMEWTVNDSGEEVLVGMYQFDAQGALKACDMLAKHVGLYEVDNKQKATKLQIDIDRQKVRAIMQENNEFVG